MTVFEEILEVMKSGEFELTVDDLGEGRIRAWKEGMRFCPITMLVNHKFGMIFNCADVDLAQEELDLNVEEYSRIVSAADNNETFIKSHYMIDLKTSELAEGAKESIEMRKQMIEVINSNA